MNILVVLLHKKIVDDIEKGDSKDFFKHFTHTQIVSLKIGNTFLFILFLMMFFIVMA